jgi:HSP20 family protein
MTSAPVEVKRATPAPTSVPDVWGSFRAEMDQLFDRFSRTFGMPSLRRMFDIEPAWRTESSFGFAAPAIDVSEDEKTYKITVELPGLEEKDLDVSISGDMIVIRGKKHQEKEQRDKNYHVAERAYGTFQRTFVLPEGVAREKIAADLSKGLLTITLPKMPEAQKPSQKIEVKAAA